MDDNLSLRTCTGRVKETWSSEYPACPRIEIKG